jgi:DNA polymerase elongation subunit (family B)
MVGAAKLSLCYLLDASSDKNTILLTVYDAGTGVVREIRDETYKPYILSASPLSKEDEVVIRDLGAEVSTAEKVDLFTGEVRTVTRVTLEDPSLVQAVSRQLKDRWEDGVPYVLSYVYDRGLVFGAPHRLEDGQLKPALEASEALRLKFQEKFSAVKGSNPRKYEMLERWFALCSQPIPEVSLKKLGLAEDADYEKVYLAFLLSRVANLPLPTAFTNRQVSTWIRSILHGYLRSMNILIPRSAELRRGVETHGVPGALTFPPKTGTYFGTVVTDFESLYPSMIDAYNLSYETVDCGHEECFSNKVPGTDHYVCKKKRGVYAAIIGALRDLRVQWFKPLSKDKSASDEERRLATSASRLLKLILVSCYGVTVRIHGLAQQALAESITAYGRHVLRSSWQLAEKQGLTPLYGDTDSLFLDNPSREQVDRLIRTVKETLNLDLAVDKIYSVCVLPRAMKAYFGIGKDGTPDVKGLTAIKSNSPLFIQNVFMDCVKELVDVKNWTQFEAAKSNIREVVKKAIGSLESGKVPLKDLVYTVTLHVDTSERLEEGEAYHQPYQCAVQLMDQGRQVDRGDSVSFIKVKPFSYRGKNFTVKPVELVKDFREVNMDDYVRNLRTALSQTFKPMNLSFKEEPKTTLADFI